ncbi:MAG TPA: TPM domain-containing protein [Thermoanaerobaculia bacterium]
MVERKGQKDALRRDAMIKDHPQQRGRELPHFQFSIFNFQFLLALIILALPAGGLEVPPAPQQWFTDAAGLIGPTEGDLLNRKLSDFEQETGSQFIIYVLPSLEGDPVEDFTIRAVERWKVGQKKYDNGLVLFVFVEERKVRVEVGYGLEGSITDAYASRVIRETIAPAFQSGRYGEGLSAAADALMHRIRTGEEAVAPLRRRGAQGEQEEPSIFVVLMILIVVFFFIAPMLSRRRGCGGCVFPFFFFPGGGTTLGGHRGGGFGGGGFGGGFGGFSGGGGGFGGGGATGGW